MLFKDDLKVVKENIDELGGTTVQNSKEKIVKLLSTVADDADAFPSGFDRRLRDAIKAREEGWNRAKVSGLAVLDKEARIAGERLLTQLKRIGLYIVPLGELKSFEYRETTDKNEWVNAVLETYKDRLANAPELEEAERTFVRGLISQ